MEVTDVFHKPNADESEKTTTVTYVYVLSGSPYFNITGIKHRKLLPLNNVKGSKNLIKRKAYFKKLKSTLANVRNDEKLSATVVKACKKLSQEQSTVLRKAYRIKELNAVLDHLKHSNSIVYILSDLTELFCTRLKELNRRLKKLKPPVVLRALKCLCLNRVSAEGDLCIEPLETFLRRSIKSRKFRLLFKDIAADILSERFYVCTNGPKSTVSWLSETFRKPGKRLEVLYGASIVGLANMTIETNAKIVPCDAFYDELLAKRVINSLKLFNKIMCVCESFIYCCVIEDLSLNQNETNSLYNMNVVVVVLYNLIRNATLHTLSSLVKYDKRTSKPFQLSHLLFDKTKLRKLLNGVTSNRKRRRLAHRNKNSSKPTTQKLISKSLFDGKKSSFIYRRDYIFWNYFNVFDFLDTGAIDYQQVFFGHDSVQYRYLYCYERASVCCEYSHWTLPLDFDVFNVNRVRQGMCQYQRLRIKKNMNKRKLDPFK